MVDLKYHVVTVVAVFMALGIGIMIGSTFIDNDFILYEQERLIDRLEKDFEFIRQQNKLVKAEVEKVNNKNKILREFIKGIQSYVIAERLKNYKLAVIQMGQFEKKDQLLTLLEKAGARVEFFKFDFNKLGNDRDKLGEISTTFINKFILGEKSEFTYSNLFESAGEIIHPSDAVIIVGNITEKNSYLIREFTIPLIRGIKEKGIYILAGEGSTSNFSCIPLYKKIGVSTIDNLDTEMGIITLVLTLADPPDEPKNFGVKASAQQLLPIK